MLVELQRTKTRADLDSSTVLEQIFYKYHLLIICTQFFKTHHLLHHQGPADSGVSCLIDGPHVWCQPLLPIEYNVHVVPKIL